MAANIGIVEAEIAKASAKAAAQLATLLSPPPIFFIIKSAGPSVYNFDVMALATHPSWYVLNYNGASPVAEAQTTANRKWINATYGWMKAWMPASAGCQLDEFPCLTAEGGPGDWLALCLHGRIGYKEGRLCNLRGGT